MVSRETSDGVLVESQADPARPGRTGYRITGLTREAVQAKITQLTNSVDGLQGSPFGFANFVGPARVDGGYGALGEVIVIDNTRVVPFSALVKTIRDAAR